MGNCVDVVEETGNVWRGHRGSAPWGLIPNGVDGEGLRQPAELRSVVVESDEDTVTDTLLGPWHS